nr:COMT protein [Stephania japonica]
MFGFTETIALRSAVQLGIPDLIHDHHDGAMTLHEIAAELSFEDGLVDEPKNLDRLNQTMRFMVHMNLFTEESTTGETKYGLTPASKLLLKRGRSGHKSLAKFVMLQTDPQELSMAARLVESLRGTKNCLELVHGMDRTNALDEMAEDAAEEEKVIDDGMTSLVDVGGNSGTVAMAILDAFPHLKCFVMELLHIVENIHKDPHLEFVVGDMFDCIPKNDIVLLKSVLHDHDDDACVKILSKSKEAISPTKGKVILVEIVVDAEHLPDFSHARLGLAMGMMFLGGKERTREEWEKVIYRAGFSRYQVIPIVAVESIIVLYP